MKLTWEHFVAIGAAVLVVLVAWFSGAWFHLDGWDRTILSTGIFAIGAAGIFGFLLWARSKQSLRTPGAIEANGALTGSAVRGPLPGSILAADDVNILIREAEKKVASARLGHGVRMPGLRQIFVLGEVGSGKTTAVLNSGLDPELLAGHVFHEGSVIPTPVVNFWFAQKSVFIEAGPNLLAEPRLWTRLIRRLAPGGFLSALQGKRRGGRAAVVCFDCEKLVNAPSSDLPAATARSLRSRLEELSQVLGCSIPVYVVFTKVDRLPYFEDFVNTLSNEESSQVLGVTLPIVSDSSAGVYAERETKRLTAVFNSLFYSLADHRLGLLSREQNTDKRPGIYEYPREFSKTSKRVVQFLVDLCRPSQLRTGPFLRGFYFTGMRMVASTASSPTIMATRTNISGLPAPAAAANATTILRQEDLAALPPWQTGTQIQSTEGRRVPQWVFLSHIFSHVLLQDRSALAASGVSTRANLWRRSLLATAGLLLLVWISGLIVSYISNRAIESDLQEAVQSLRGATTGSQQPTLDSLRRLDTLRERLVSLRRYERTGIPLHLRWGLYTGHTLYPAARQIYFDRFRQLLFGQIRNSMIDTLRRLPDAPGPNDEYLPNYDTLKAYLITTANPEKSTVEFLSPVLLRYWSAGQNIDGTLRELTQAQCDFFAQELELQNPYSDAADIAVRIHARDYLNRFGALPRMYTAMQNEAAKQNMPVNFYRDYPSASDVLRSVPEVPGAFTKAGWGFMQNAITHSDQYFRGEEWVLGGTSEALANRADVESQLRTMYQAEYIKRWQDFLRSARVVPYAGLEDAARKLKRLSANESPLLQVLCSASLNTAGRSPEIDKAFKPVQQVVPPACESRLVTPITTPYVAGLAKLGFCLESVSTAPPDQRDNQRQQCSASANEAKLIVAAQIVPAMDVDPLGHINQTVQALLEAPIAVPGPPPPTGSGAKGLCDSFGELTTKYPFNPNNDRQDVTLQEFNEFFRPGDGTLAKFIQANQPVLALQGNQYVLKPGVKVDWGPTFLPFVNRAYSIQQAIYPGGAVQPQYKFTVHAFLPEGGITGVAFTLNSQTLRYPGGPQTATFMWPGSETQETKISYRAGGGQETDILSAKGPWAILKFISVSDARVTPGTSTLSAEWHPLQADRRTPLTLTGTGRPIVVHLDFDAGAAPFVFQGENFSSMVCRAAR